MQVRLSRRSLLMTTGSAMALLLAGCAAPSEPMGMALAEGDALQLRGWMPAALRAQLMLQPVAGGEATSKLWGSKISSLALEHALEDSLRAVGLLALNPQTALYELQTELVGLDQPLVALDTTVKVAMHFRLVERSNQRLLYQRTVRAAHTSELGDALLSQPERMRMANEAAVRQGITAMLRDLPNLRL